ncbi:hypothetical protein H2200_000257 [Cladophialophora chaetospira]|uniref:C2H2-type domain-containing protein n=1 Tax=Cladophialophora chaetospira TaxID=386627 RepID=A0AA39CQS1_9EURO|nr:hypothetical protein H2200_000257 [Cladophialophora chaetospira]
MVEHQRSDGSLKASLNRALDRCRHRLTKEEEQQFLSVTLRSLKLHILEIQEQQGRAKKLRNLTRMDMFLNVMGEWEQLVANLIEGSDFGALIWGLVKNVLEAASTLGESFELLLDAYEKIGLNLPSLADHRALFTEAPEARTVLVWLYTDVVEFHMGALRFFSGPAWRRTFRSFWKDYETKFGGFLKGLGNSRSFINEQEQTQFLQHSRVDRMKVREAVKQFDELRDRLVRDIKDRDLRERRSHFADVLGWIAASSPLHEHAQACYKRKDERESGEWLLHKRPVEEWKDSDAPDSSILWLHGMPGAGKTVLASKIIEACGFSESEESTNTIFFYCVQKDPAKNTFTSIVKSLLSQALSQSRDALLPLCYERCSKSSEVTLQSPKLAMDLLESCLIRIAQQVIILDQQKTHERQYIIVDGLDECEPGEWQQLIDLFQRILKNLGPDSVHLRVLFVSQHTNQIEKVFKATPSVKITSQDNGEDIKVYARRRTGEIGDRFGLDARQVQEIVQDTCKGAAGRSYCLILPPETNAKTGMFLYARLVMDNLRDQPTRKMFDEERARKFPDGLSEAYERILQRIKRDFSARNSSNLWETIRMLLGWLVCACRPLKWKEIQLAHCIDLDSDAIDLENEKLRYHIRDYCGSIIEAPPENQNEVDQEHETVRFVHSTTGRRGCSPTFYEHALLTVNRYLVTTGFVNELLAEANLTAKCVRYVSLPCFDETLPPTELEWFSLRGYYIFQDYAVAKWSEHVLKLFEKVSAAKGQDQQMLSASEHEAPKKAQMDLALLELGDALRRFTEMYDSAFSETANVPVTLGAWDKLGESEDTEDLYYVLCAVLAHVKQHQKGPYDTKNKISIPALLTTFERNRAFLEDPSHKDFKIEMSPTDQQKMKDLYGEKRYKCPKLNCDWFFYGFSDRKSRKKHVDKHDRPFRCDVKECAGELGFTSKHDLEVHKKSFHTLTGPDQAETFEPLESLSLEAESKAKWPCPNCPKRFTRGFHLRNHIRTHTNERPFSCTECHKTFTRDYDRKRHEKTVHAGK